MSIDPYTPEHPGFDTLEIREKESPTVNASAPEEDQAQTWTNQALFDCYND